MGFSKMTTDVLNISKLPDSVQGNAKDLKATFDKAGEDIKEAHNKLVDELAEQNAASNIGAMSEEGATTVQAELDKLNKRIKIDYTELEVVVDDKLSEESENAVQNKVITQEFERVDERIDINAQYNVLSAYTDELKGENSYNRNYNIEGLPIPKKGTRLEIWNDNKIIPSTQINTSNVYSDPNSIELNNGNIFCVYNQGGSTIYSTILSRDLKVIKHRSLYSGSTSGIYICKIKNGNIVVSFCESNKSDEASFMIISADGLTTIKSTTVVESTYGGQPYCSPLEDGGFVISYRKYVSSSDVRCSMVICNENGDVVVPEVIVKKSSQINDYTRTHQLKNGNIVVLYADSGNSRTCFKIYDTLGNSVLGETEISSGTSSYLEIIDVDDDKFLILANKSLYLYNINGLPLKQAVTAFSAGDYTNMVKLKNGNILVFIIGSDPNSTSKALISKTYDKELNLIFDESIISKYSYMYTPKMKVLIDDTVLAVFLAGTTSSYSNRYMYASILTEEGYGELNYYSQFSTNSINDIEVDTIMKNGFYELVYDNNLYGEKYYAKEVRV